MASNVNFESYSNVLPASIQMFLKSRTSHMAASVDVN